MLSLVPLVLLSLAPPPESFHLVMVKEVYPGSDSAPNAQYVVLQMYALGQNLVAGKQVRVFNAANALVGTFTFATDVANGADQATLLIATPEAETFFGGAGTLPADLAMSAAIPRLGGKVCFHDPAFGSDIDCVAWGGYAGPSTGVGTPFNVPVGLVRGAAMRRRLDVCLSAGLLEFCDDTGNSANDFRSLTPDPRNNAGNGGTIPPAVCGNGAVQGLEQCDDGNTAGGDGCSATCRREPGAFTAQALSVDPVPGITFDGNGVLEPGESNVSVRPSWRNASTAALPLTGALSTFTGPAGAIYTVLDGIGGYGTLAAGATVSCSAAADCYRLSVSNPATRPASHWDASSAEVMSSYSFKTWALHVGDSFLDAPRSHVFYGFIETVLHRGVTGGCAANLYCPADSVTRAQMAKFLLASKEGPGYAPPACVIPAFADVPCSHILSAWINELAARGITGGCAVSPLRYCPDATVTRRQMAVFLLRTKEGSAYQPPPAVGDFDDVPVGAQFADWIEDLADRGITSGCQLSPPLYCPDAGVTRGQMAVFLARTFALTLYGP